MFVMKGKKLSFKIWTLNGSPEEKFSSDMFVFSKCSEPHQGGNLVSVDHFLRRGGLRRSGTHILAWSGRDRAAP